MKITITGSLGHISKPLAETLVQKGHSVTVISSKREKQIDIEALGARAAIGSVDDVDFLTAAFTGADAVYTMVPPPASFFDHNFDMMARCLLLANNFAQAIRQSGVQRVVHLSSIGAHLDKGTGLILSHHAVESILNELSGVAITFMRPVAFYYNLYGFSNGIITTGVIASNYGGEDKVAWVAPVDIAAAVAEELVTPIAGEQAGSIVVEPVKLSGGRKVRYVASEELSCSDIASILGAAIGKPDLKWIVISDEQMLSGLEAAGMPKQFAADYVAMNASMHRGELFQDYYLNSPHALGKLKMRDFAREFAAAFKRQ
jgi:uncharacterized protein YbjT (DUF2867 family)